MTTVRVLDRDREGRERYMAVVGGAGCTEAIVTVEAGRLLCHCWVDVETGRCPHTDAVAVFLERQAAGAAGSGALTWD